MGRKLHLGCGEVYLPGYVNIDYPSEHHPVQQRSKADVYADIMELTYPPDSVEEIRLHHVFEHFDRATAVHLLIEWYRWLKEGGKLVIETPDFERCVRAFISRHLVEDQLKVLRHIFGSHEAPWAVHYDGWYRAKIELFLDSLGYQDLAFASSKWRGTYNITVTGRKLHPFKTREEQTQVAERLLRLSLVDDSESEERMLKVWTDRLRCFGNSRNGS